MLKSHWKYLKYVLRHKWYVLWAGWKIGAPKWRLLVHDWTKFLPREWLPYTKFFYGEKTPAAAADFKIAWNHHQKHNPHHWQFWVLVNDSDEPKISALDMPEHFIREMVADWVGAGLAITGQVEVQKWYNANYDQIILSERTRERVDFLVGYAQGLLEDYHAISEGRPSVFASGADSAGNLPLIRNCIPVSASSDISNGSGSDDSRPTAAE